MPLVPGVFFYFSSTPTMIPSAFAHLIRRIPFRPKTLVFITVVSVNVARVHDGLTVSAVGVLEGVHRAVLNVGYAQAVPDMAKLAARILRKLRYMPPTLHRLHHASVTLSASAERLHPVGNSAEPIKVDPPTAADDNASVHTTAEELAAWATDELYVAACDPTLLIGRDAVFARPGTSWWHRLCVAGFAGLCRISRAQAVALNIPSSNLLEVGFRVEL
jgi:K+ transporter